MALITCKECECRISDQADACPHCGFSFEKERKAKAEKQEVERRVANDINNRRRKELSSRPKASDDMDPSLPYVCGGGGVIVIIALVQGGFQQAALMAVLVAGVIFVVFGPHTKRTLVPCEACGRMVSDMAKICPICGNPQY